MYKRILVPVDGHATSERALQEAIKLANEKARLRLIYVLEGTYALDSVAYSLIDHSMLQEAMRSTGERALAQAAEKVRKAGLEAETALIDASTESISSVIDSDAMNWKADLIVIGTHGRSGLSRFLLGSIAEDVVRAAPVPVLLVRSA